MAKPEPTVRDRRMDKMLLDDDGQRWLDRHPEIRTLGLIVYTPKGFDLFLHKPQPRFGARMALQLIVSGESAQVYAALAADHEGLGF